MNYFTMTTHLVESNSLRRHEDSRMDMEQESIKKRESIDYSRQKMNFFPKTLLSNMNTCSISHLNLSGNNMMCLPEEVSSLCNLNTLDMTSNKLNDFPKVICKLQKLNSLFLQNNFLDYLPEDILCCKNLQTLNLSGNKFDTFPLFVEHLSLLELSLGGNFIDKIPKTIERLRSLEYFYIGGNRLTSLPEELGKLNNLKMLNICDNKIKSIPKEFSKLKQLESLSLHNNNLTVLPSAIVRLKNLRAMSIRGNPLVVRFVRTQATSVPTLQELTGRTIKNSNIQYSVANLPISLLKYLDSSRKCVNPKCSGVFFETCVQHIKFVDFCGKYRLPFEQFLCSLHENEQWDDLNNISSDEDEMMNNAGLMKKVLLG